MVPKSWLVVWFAVGPRVISLKRLLLVFCAVLGMARAHAQDLMKTASTLPAFNVLCYRIIITNFSDEMPGQIVMGKFDDHARFNLYTVDGGTLKVVNNPEEPGLRQEYGKFASEINISPVKDPSKRAPVFSWQEAKSFGLTVYSYEANDRVLSIVKLSKPNKMTGTVHTNEVLKCRDK
jgi:hypothetical protein